MSRIPSIIGAALLSLLVGCSSDKAPEPQKLAPFALSLADKEKLASFQKELINVETLADSALKVAGEELKTVLTGGEVSVNLPSIIQRGKSECLKAAESLATKAVPEALPPEAQKCLKESKTGFVACYKAYAESFDCIKRFATEKNPMALVEYRKKNAEAAEQLKAARSKLKSVVAAAGLQ